MIQTPRTPDKKQDRRQRTRQKKNPARGCPVGVRFNWSIIFGRVARSLGVFVFELLQTLQREKERPTNAQARRVSFGNSPRVSAQARRLHHLN